MGSGQSSSNANVSSLHSFSSGGRTKEVIVVKQRTNTSDASCSRNDDAIKRFLEIPKFYPILKSSLNQPGLRDPPKAIFKISERPVLKFAYRLQEHLSRCANIVVLEQESLGNSVKDVDCDITLLLVQFNNRKRSVDRFQNYREQINDLKAHISNLRFFFQDLIPVTMTLNEYLPKQKRLPLMDIDCLVNALGCSSDEKNSEIDKEIERDTCSKDNNQDALHISPVDEVVVIDKNDA